MVSSVSRWVGASITMLQGCHHVKVGGLMVMVFEGEWGVITSKVGGGLMVS